MRDQDLLDWTTANYEAIAAAAESGSDTAIPSCPGWTMSDLLSHTSNTINGWFVYNIARATTSEPGAACTVSARW